MNVLYTVRFLNSSINYYNSVINEQNKSGRKMQWKGGEKIILCVSDGEQQKS